MLNKLSHYKSVILYTYRVNLLQILEFPTWLLPWLVAEFFYDISLFYMINVLISRFQTFPGWGQYEIGFLFGVGLLSEAFFVIFFSSIYEIGNYVKDGEFDKFLIKPLGVYQQFTFKRVNFIGISEVVSSVIILIYCVGKLEWSFTAIGVIKLIIFTICATLLRYAFFTIINSVSFWTKKITALHSIASQLTNEVTRYPITIFPNVVQKFFTFIFPIAFIAYYPASNIVNKQLSLAESESSTIVILAVSILFLVLSIKIFYIGLKKYESAGS